MVAGHSGGKLFISYSRRNREQVYPLVEALVKAGIDLWIDREEVDPLDDFPARIREGLARSQGLLAWYSSEYAKSSYCQKELTSAWICTQRLARDVLSRILIVNPEENVAHIALGDVGRQNYLAAPTDAASLDRFIQSIREKLVGFRTDFAALSEFKKPDWRPSLQPGSSRFVGRLWELWRIHTELNPVGISAHEDPSIIVQLTGLGGIGKSLLAIEYAKRFGAAYPGGIHWLRAHGFDSNKAAGTNAQDHERQRQIEDLALLHDIPIRDKDFREVCRDLGKKLAAGEPYLWIVDDLSPGLDQMLGFTGWCAPSANGHTLITTRSKEYAGLGTTVEIDVLDPAAAFTLLTQKRKPQNRQEQQDVQELAEDLGRHALALDVAGHFLLEGKGFAALREELASVQSDLLGEISAGLLGQLPGGHEKSIVATLLQSVRLLDQEGLSLLRLACELQGGTPIPFRLADKTFAHAFALTPQLAESYRRSAINQLMTHSLGVVSLGGAGWDALSVHTLVRYTLYHGDPALEDAPALRQQLHESTVLALVELLPGVTDIRNHASLELEVDHARHLALEPDSEAEARLCTWLARFARQRGNFREALAIARKSLPIFSRVLGVDHPDTLGNRANLSLYLGEAGERGEALKLCLELLPDQERVLGVDHPDTLTNRNNIASFTGQTGEAREALRLFRELLTDQTRALGTDHPETLRTRANLSFFVGEAGDREEALRLCLELLPDQERVLGVDHPDTLRSRNNIAYFTGQTGEAREALRLCYELLPDQMRVLGAEHPETLTNRNNIAYFTGLIGEASEALRLSLDLLPDQTKVLGMEHPETLRTRSNIAYFTGQTGEAREALRLCLELLPDQTRVLGHDHPETLTNRNNIAYFNGLIGEVGEALRLGLALLPDQARVLGADHPETLRTRNNIAYFTGQTGEVHEALRLFRELLPDQTRVLGADHPETLTNRNNIAYFTGQTGEVLEALRLFRELLPDQTRVLGAGHPETLNTQEWINSLQRRQRRRGGWFSQILFGDPEQWG